MADDGVERACREILQLEVDGSAGDPRCAMTPSSRSVDQGLQRTARRHALLESDLLGVVQVDEWQRVETQPLETLLDGASNAIAGEVGRARAAGRPSWR